MTEAAKPETEHERPNSIAPGPQPDPGPAAAAAEAKPCECAERVDSLEFRMGIQEKLAKAMSWTLLACAAAVLWLTWTSSSADKASSKAGDG